MTQCNADSSDSTTVQPHEAGNTTQYRRVSRRHSWLYVARKNKSLLQNSNFNATPSELVIMLCITQFLPTPDDAGDKLALPACALPW